MPNNKTVPKIFIISGPSGSGKNSVTAPLRQMKDKFIFSISYTTRKNIRPGETRGVDYHFISDDQFDRAIEHGEFLEWEQVFENKYGTKKADFERLFSSGKIIVTVVDVKGAMNIRKAYPEAPIMTVFIVPPNPKEAEKRLQSRGTESPESIARRKARLQMELGYRHKYDYVIVNDILADAQQKLKEIIDQKLAAPTAV